jgi:hypothetical protein
MNVDNKGIKVNSVKTIKKGAINRYPHLAYILDVIFFGFFAFIISSSLPISR